MKKTTLIICTLIALILTCNQAQAQTQIDEARAQQTKQAESRAQRDKEAKQAEARAQRTKESEARYQRMKDSLDHVNYDKGDLYQLVQNAYFVFKAYSVGRGAQFQREVITKPFVDVYDKQNKKIFIRNKRELKYIPVEVVQTVEVTYDHDTSYGQICWVRIVLKDEWAEAYMVARREAGEPLPLDDVFFLNDLSKLKYPQ